MPSFINFLAHSNNENIQKATTKEIDPIYIKNYSF